MSIPVEDAVCRGAASIRVWTLRMGIWPHADEHGVLRTVDAKPAHSRGVRTHINALVDAFAPQFAVGISPGLPYQDFQMPGRGLLIYVLFLRPGTPTLCSTTSRAPAKSVGQGERGRE